MIGIGPRVYLCCLIAVLTAAGCTPEPTPPDYVARVGSQYLTQPELGSLLAALPVGEDTTDARQQIIEQWVTRTLLYQEALRRGLREDPDVQRLLVENERSVIVSALVGALFEESNVTPSDEDIRAYFNANKEQLRLLEPFVRVRHLATARSSAAQEARRRLQQLNRAEEPDSAWAGLVRNYAADPPADLGLSDNYVAERHLFQAMPALRSALLALRPSEIAPVIEVDSLYHVLQLVERKPAGTLPELPWIEEEIVRRLVIRNRKQMYARQVQRLRTEAQAQEALEIR